MSADPSSDHNAPRLGEDRDLNDNRRNGIDIERAARFGSVALPLIGIVLIVLLSIKLFTERRLNATFRAEIARSTRGFVAGVTLPALRMLPHGQTGTIDLRDLCETRRPLVVYFWGARCLACQDLKEHWPSFSARRPDLAFVFVSVGEVSVPTESGLPDAIHTMSPIAPVHDAFGVSLLPAVFVADSACQLVRAGVGRYAVEAVVSDLSANGRP